MQLGRKRISILGNMKRNKECSKESKRDKTYGRDIKNCGVENEK